MPKVWVKKIWFGLVSDSFMSLLIAVSSSAPVWKLYLNLGRIARDLDSICLRCQAVIGMAALSTFPPFSDSLSSVFGCSPLFGSVSVLFSSRRSDFVSFFSFMHLNLVLFSLNIESIGLQAMEIWEELRGRRTRASIEKKGAYVGSSALGGKRQKAQQWQRANGENERGSG